MPHKIKDISAVIITRDAARTVERCLAPLAVFDEVVVCDTGSTDDTIARARKFANVRVFEISFDGFGAAKQTAVDKAANDWIFSVDADEIADGELMNALAAFDTGGDRRRLGVIDRRNFFLGRHIRHGGLGRDRIPRLFHRQVHAFSKVKVHEGVMPTTDSKKFRLAGGVDHLTTPDINTRIDKMRDYSELAAPTARVFHPVLVVLRSLYTFVKSYLLQLGFVAGWRGLLIAWCAAGGVFIKYMKSYAIKKLAAEEFARWRRHKKFHLKQIFTGNDEIAVHKSWRQVAVWKRAHHCDELMSFFQNPDAWMAGGEVLRVHRSRTIVRVSFGARGGGGGDRRD